MTNETMSPLRRHAPGGSAHSRCWRLPEVHKAAASMRRAANL
jgi:hypothetical protein